MNIVRTFLWLPTILYPLATMAAFKCTQPDGTIVYQQTQCSSSFTQTEIRTTPKYDHRDSSSALSQRSPRLDLPEFSKEPVELLPLLMDDQAIVEKLSSLLHAITVSLKDPTSVIFQHICLQRGKLYGKEYLFLSGFANAKNSFGGYVGNKLIFAIEGAGVRRTAYDNATEIFVEHEGRKWYPPAGYWVCREMLLNNS